MSKTKFQFCERAVAKKFCYTQFFGKNHSINLKKNFCRKQSFLQKFGTFLCHSVTCFQAVLLLLNLDWTIVDGVVKDNLRKDDLFFTKTRYLSVLEHEVYPGKSSEFVVKIPLGFIFCTRSRGFRTTCFETKNKKNIQPLHRRYKTYPWSIGENISKTFKSSTDMD